MGAGRRHERRTGRGYPPAEGTEVACEHLANCGDCCTSLIDPIARLRIDLTEAVIDRRLLAEGRVYGGGLHKVEPKELAQIPARAVLESIDGHSY